MAARRPMATPNRDLRALWQADRIAHGTWDPREPTDDRLSRREIAGLLIGLVVIVAVLCFYLSMAPR